MAQDTNTRVWQLLDLLLDGGLETFVLERRQRGEPWRTVARDVYEETKVDITGETLRSWYGKRAS